MLQPLGAREAVRDVLEQDLDAALPGEQDQLFERGERRVDLALVVLLAADADCWIR